MCRKLIYILLLFLLASCGAGRSLKRAEQSYARGEYFDAAKYYRKAYAATPPKQRKQRGEIAYKMAGCYRLINYNVRAKGAYMNAIRYHYPDSVTHFYLAESLRKNGEYKPAIASYKTYLQYRPNDTLALNGLQSCTLAQEWKEHPTRHIVKREAVFFSRRSDYSPMYAGDDTDIIYFTSTRNEAKGNDLNGITGMKSADIFSSKRDEKKNWQKPEPLESEVNSEFEDGACSFSADGKTMYFTRCRTSPEAPVYAEIFASARTGANWGTPTKCAILNDSLSSVAHPAMSPALFEGLLPVLRRGRAAGEQQQEQREYDPFFHRSFVFGFQDRVSSSFSHASAAASEGIRQSPRGERVTVPTFGPSGMAERLNCCEKKRRMKTPSHLRTAAASWLPAKARSAR